MKLKPTELRNFFNKLGKAAQASFFLTLSPITILRGSLSDAFDLASADNDHIMRDAAIKDAKQCWNDIMSSCKHAASCLRNVIA